MAITYVGSVSNPADNGAQAGSPVAVDPSSLTINSGDLLILVGEDRANNTVTMTVSQTGGQTWTALAQFAGTFVSTRYFWAKYNGTFTANPSVALSSGTTPETVLLHVFRPTNSANTWAVDTAANGGTITGTAGAHLQLITGITTTNPSNVSLFTWLVAASTTWSTLAGANWVATNPNQVRNTNGSAMTNASAYQIQTVAGATGDVSQNQAAANNGVFYTCAFNEISSASSKLALLGVG